MRIFQGQTVLQIVKTLLGEHQVNLEETKLTGSYRVDYCVHQESSPPPDGAGGDCAHFSHEADKGVSAPTWPRPSTSRSAAVIPTPDAVRRTDEEGISQWALEDSVTPGIYSLDDYDFRKPNAWLFRGAAEPGVPEAGQHRRTTGRASQETGYAEFYARIRQERWQVEHQQILRRRPGIAPGQSCPVQRAVLQRQRGVSGDGGVEGITRGEPLRER